MFIVILLTVSSISIGCLSWKVKVLRATLLSKIKALNHLEQKSLHKPEVPTPFELLSETVIYEEIAERKIDILKTNEAYECALLTPQKDMTVENSQYEYIDLH